MTTHDGYTEAAASGNPSSARATGLLDGIENFKPGGLKKFGLDPTQTTKRWPRLIHASINGFGSAHERNHREYNQTANATIASVTISQA